MLVNRNANEDLLIEYLVTLDCATTSSFEVPNMLRAGLEFEGDVTFESSRVREASEPVRGNFRLSYDGVFTELMRLVNLMPLSYNVLTPLKLPRERRDRQGTA